MSNSDLSESDIAIVVRALGDFDLCWRWTGDTPINENGLRDMAEDILNALKDYR